MWLSAPISITVEGANILSRNLMIFGQGAIRCHPFVLREMELVHEPDRDAAVNKFDDLLTATSASLSATRPAPCCWA